MASWHLLLLRNDRFGARSDGARQYSVPHAHGHSRWWTHCRCSCAPPTCFLFVQIDIIEYIYRSVSVAVNSGISWKEFPLQTRPGELGRFPHSRTSSSSNRPLKGMRLESYVVVVTLLEEMVGTNLCGRIRQRSSCIDKPRRDARRPHRRSQRRGTMVTLLAHPCYEYHIIQSLIQGTENIGGYLGQLAAVLRHYVSRARLDLLQRSGVPILILTGISEEFRRVSSLSLSEMSL